MADPVSVLLSVAAAGRPSADLRLAWIDAAGDAERAYVVWREAERSEQATASAVYRAALDREEAAARALERRRTVMAPGPDRPTRRH